jgi:hypothetical protein
MLDLMRKFAPALAAGFALGVALAWGLQALRLAAVQNDFAAYRVQAEANALAARAAASAAEERWAAALQEANDEHQNRLAQAQTDFAAARRASGELRDALAAMRSRLAEAPAAAVAVALAATGDVLGDCAESYREMAATADRHVADVSQLIRAWPRPAWGVSLGIQWRAEQK